MASGRSFTDRVVKIKKLANSVNGNPQFEITLAENGTYRTKKDAQVGYAVGNFMIDRRFIVELGSRETIIDMIRLAD